MGSNRASGGAPGGIRKSSSSAYPPRLAATSPMVMRWQASARTASGLTRETAARTCFTVWNIKLVRAFGARRPKHDFGALPPFYRQPGSLDFNGPVEIALDPFVVEWNRPIAPPAGADRPRPPILARRAGLGGR